VESDPKELARNVKPQEDIFGEVEDEVTPRGEKSRSVAQQ